MDRSRAPAAVVAALVAIAILGGCRANTVRLDPHPEVGDRARYRYVIVATITSALDGMKPTTSTIETTLEVDQHIVGVGDDGVQADVALRRDGGAKRTARVVLDATGAIRGVELVAGLPNDTLGLSQLGALLPRTLVPPSRALAPGERWTIAGGPIEGRGRLVRLAVEHGTNVAVVRTTITQDIDEAVTSGTTAADLAGAMHAVTTTTYDLANGSVRRSTGHSNGKVRVRIEPPAGVDAAAALGMIGYDIKILTTRLT